MNRFGWWRDSVVWLSATTVCALVAALLVVAGYHAWDAPRRPSIATVDLEQIVARWQQRFGELARSGDKAAIEEGIAMAERSPQQLATAVEELAAECGCLILVKAAVVTNAADLTPRLMAKLRLSDQQAATPR